MKTIDAKNARDLLAYSPETGVLTWRRRDKSRFKNERDAVAWNSRYAGTEAGTRHCRGYIIVRIDGCHILAHRLIWLIVHGDLPAQIDHINGVRTDNRLTNLRSVDALENQKNLRRPKNNKSGVIGVCWDSTKRKWLAQIKVERRNRFIGLFDSLEDAAAARLSAQKLHGFHQNHGRAG